MNKSQPMVTLVGAGPGDPELLTLKAVKALQAATVVLVDDLVHPEVLKHVPSHARIVHVGKRGGCQSTPQAFIEKLMVQAAFAGENVVRLKGGDPLIFGRGGEERDHLQSQGIEVRIVNGITAGVAAFQDLGVALTHRAHAHGVVMVTGHATDKGLLSPIDWVGLAQAAHASHLTLVIYMGVQNIATIQQGLLTGLPPSTPVAIVQQASQAQGRQAHGELKDLQSLLLKSKLASPAIIIVGDVLHAMAAFEKPARNQQA
ncbi:MAG: uroporphyrinogen-III C-methyltransferase [Betaproteobacteria bacterium]|nr:uroporphyrinogen-III C-methyltransferase [Betaproteobacteria bacterium]